MVESLVDTLEDMINKDMHSPLTLFQLRSYLILIENPLVIGEDSEYYNLLFWKILQIIHSLHTCNVNTLHIWLSNYSNTNRLKVLMNSLHQCMTLTIELNELEIEDETNDALIEFNFDDIEDAEEREEISRKIERRQQRTREKCIKKSISLIVSFTDIIFHANELIIQKTAELNETPNTATIYKTTSITNLLKKQKTNNNNNNNSTPMVMDIIGETEEEDSIPLAMNEIKEEEKNASSNMNRRLSLIGISNHKIPLPLSIFHNDGLNEAICANDNQRQVIHRRDFFHWRDGDFFTFLNHAYLLTAGSKSRYLEFENHIRQFHARRRGMMDLMFAGHLHINRDRLMEQLDLVLNVRRTHIISDSLGILQLQESQDLRKRLRIIFDGEQGIDQGGLTKEYFQLMCKEIFDPKFGMFVFLEDNNYYWFNMDVFLLCNDKEKEVVQANYELIGKLMGIALYNNTILDLHFPKVIFKKLLGLEIDFLDFVDFNSEMAAAFETLLTFDENDGKIENVYCWNFVHSRKNVFDEDIEYQLKENGNNILLNNENKYEFVNLYMHYLLVDSIRVQFESFCHGFKMVCDSKLFSKLKGEELELLICGSQNFDFEELEKSARYEDGLCKDSQLIIDFWDIAHQFCDDNKRKLLKFCTGSDRIPIRGLGALRLKISKNGTDNAKLPTSHTCFNHLLLPEYSTKEILNQRLLLAIQNSEGFGLL